MTGFWQSGSGKPITGKFEDSVTPDFSTIPEGTRAHACIKSFELVEKEKTDYSDAMKYYQITWTLTSGDFKGRQVTQKIKCFAGTAESIDRALNMMKLIMDLCNFKPAHGEAPTTQELMPMIGTILGVNIREWSMQKKDGSGMLEGNFVSEVHPAQNFQCETGVKAEVKRTPSQLDSAFSRNPRVNLDDLDNDVPF
jgi:hypothetical protein